MLRDHHHLGSLLLTSNLVQGLDQEALLLHLKIDRVAHTRVDPRNL